MIARPSSYPREARKCDRIRDMNGYPKETAPQNAYYSITICTTQFSSYSLPFPCRLISSRLPAVSSLFSVR